MLDVIYRIVVTPLVYLIELVFSLLYGLVGNPGLAIVGVSLVVNLLCLPLYAMADRTQARERERQREMAGWVAHIRRAFTGDERYLMLQTYYRQRGYNPLSAVKGSLSLLLQIPIFMAAYSYLSQLGLLKGVSFLGIPDLGAPDATLALGGLTLNVLPILMTLLNCASTFVYTRGLGLRDKVQAYGLAALFLVLLYQSPAGLVLYWTCNQVFSLAKNVVLERRGWKLEADQDVGPRSLVVTFALAALAQVVLVGLLVPSALISSATTEFINASDFVAPLSHLGDCACVVAGLVVLWVGIYFLLARRGGREAMAGTLWALVAVGMVDYFLFGQELGIITSSLVFDSPPAFGADEVVTNTLVVVAVAALSVLFWVRLRKFVNHVLAVVVVSLVALTVPNLMRISEETAAYQREVVTYPHASGGEPVVRDPEYFEADGSVRKLFTLSRTGRNVVVMFVDRAIGAYVPYLLNERPDLVERLDGFTYYPNTLSFGRFTVFGSPGLYGGYDYSVEAMNARGDVSLRDKHNEALRVMPLVFTQAGFHVTDIYPSLVDYDFYNHNYALFDGIENLDVHYCTGEYTDHYYHDFQQVTSDAFGRNLVCYSLFRVAPLLVAPTLYDGGTYHSTSMNHAVNRTFLDNYAVLRALPELTDVDAGGSDNVLIMGNSMTHDVDLLQRPGYVPSPFVSADTDYDRFTLDGRTMAMHDEVDLKHYHSNMGALLLLADWFDYLRAEGVYDNTRIIVVSDHGASLGQFDDLLFDGGQLDVEGFNPLLLVKDFDMHGFRTVDALMTNADTPSLATYGLIEGATNPFTGNPLTSDEKNAHPQLVNDSSHWKIDYQQGTTFDMSDGHWYRVHDSIFDEGCWSRVDE